MCLYIGDLAPINLRLKYGAHSVPKTFNKLIHLANKINQFSIFTKITF